jgi:hypothetical protein
MAWRAEDDLPRHLIDPAPRAGVVRLPDPEMALRDLVHPAVDPGRGVHAVRDRGDRHLGVVEARPQAVEHAAADVPVQPGHPVGPLRQPQAHHRHVEDPGLAARVGLGAQGEDALHRQLRHRVVAAEVGADQVGAEPVDAGRHRGVRGEHRRRPHRLERLLEREALRARQLADALQPAEPGVALVGVVDVRDRCPGEPRPQPQRADATDAQQHLLLQPVLAAAAVEPVGDAAGRLVVRLHVGVEQQQRHAAHLGAPHVRHQPPAAGEPDDDLARRPVVLAQQRQRQPVRVEHRVGLLLPALAGQRLLEVARLVEQADADDRHAQVGGRLEVVPGEDAEAA